MKKILLILLLFTSISNAQIGIFKYSTFYFGGGLNATINEANKYQIIDGVLSQTNNDNGFDYRINYGVRRLARLNMESKGKTYVDGSETKWGKYRSSILSGFEYLIAVDHIRDRGISFVNQTFWGRYLSKYWLLKLENTKIESVDLKYKQIDIRLKKDINKFQISCGVVSRFHPAHGVDPFNDNFNGNNDFISVAQDLGFNQIFYWNDVNNNGLVDRLEQSFFYWTNPSGDTIANTNNEFLKYHYSDIINQYNSNEIERLGIQTTISSIFGLSFYTYENNDHTLIWFNVIPWNVPLSEFGYSDEIDYEIGALVQKSILKNVSLYGEMVYLQYLNKQNFNIKFGINLLII